MDVVLIYNGLGNQMSQYALYLRKKSEGQRVRFICQSTAHNGIELGRVFGIDVKMRVIDRFLLLLYHIVSTDKAPLLFKPTQRLLSYLGIMVYREKSYAFNPTVVKQGNKRLRFLSGGWHHSDYFSTIEEKVREVYKFPQIEDVRNLKIIKETQKENVVAIHIRRGDFLNNMNYEKFGKICSVTYYQKAIEKMSSEVPAPFFYVFTNDQEWSRLFFDKYQFICVEWNTYNNSWQDLYLMSLFKNIIIANSTFSWWAAWLGYGINKNGNVICPSKFVSTESSSQESIYMDRWYKIAVE